MEFKNNSYKRYYIAGLLVMLALVIVAISKYADKKVYKVYIEDRLVGITAESPETIERTYNEVKAKRYAQGANVIKEDINISEGSLEDNQQLVTRDELANRLYVELEEEENLITTIIIPPKIIEEKIPRETIYVDDDSLYVGEEKVLSDGQDGIRRLTVRKIVDENGKIDEQTLNEQVVKTSSPKIVAVGTKEKQEYIVPVEDYKVTSTYGPRWGRTHQGIDLAVSTGTSVQAAADGVVTQSGWNGGYGISIYVDHGNGVVTRYAHLSQAYAQVGREVKQGETIGLSGNTGNSTGPHLHFEIRVGDESVDPLNYVEIEDN